MQINSNFKGLPVVLTEHAIPCFQIISVSKMTMAENKDRVKIEVRAETDKGTEIRIYEKELNYFDVIGRWSVALRDSAEIQR